jgi:hypothetical protein
VYKRQVLDEFYDDQKKLTKKELINAIQMALLKTTKAPKVKALLLAFGKKESLLRLEEYQKNYKNRI